jgi:hypothetical protein
MNDWRAAWERDKYEVGRAMHEGWKRQKIANGFADHPFVECNRPAETCHEADRCHKYLGCERPKDRHHADMIDWDALPEHQQAINYEGGREGFRLGFEAGVASVARPC